MGVADDVVSIFVAAGLGVYGDTIFIGPRAALPDTDQAFLTINVLPGVGPEGTHNSTSVPAYVRPSVQIVARATLVSDAEALALAAYLALFPVRNRIVNGTWWRSITMKQEPFELGEDVMSRPRIAFNFDCVKRLSPATS